CPPSTNGLHGVGRRDGLLGRPCPTAYHGGGWSRGWAPLRAWEGEHVCQLRVSDGDLHAENTVVFIAQRPTGATGATPLTARLPVRTWEPGKTRELGTPDLVITYVKSASPRGFGSGPWRTRTSN